MSTAVSTSGIAATEIPVGTTRVAVVIPALNEEDAIGIVLHEIPELVSRIVVVDNGSTDHTSEIARQLGADVVLEPQRGYGSACLAGIRALPTDTELVVFMDADHSDFPEDLLKLIRPILENHVDFVVGTRMTNQQARNALTPQQRFGNRLAVFLIRYFWGFSYSDLGPFRAIRRSALETLSMCDPDFGWTVEMQIKAVLAGMRTIEIPVQYRLRIGHSKVSGTIKGVLLAGSKILFTILRFAWLTRHQRKTSSLLQ